MTIRREILNVIRKNLVSVIENRDNNGLHTIYINVDKESGEISFNDDNENTLKEVVIFDWIGKKDILTNEIIVQALRDVIQMAKNDKVFESSTIFKPFTIYYADDSNTVVEELLCLEDGGDDSGIDLGEDILIKLDREFDEFLEKLLKN